MGRSFVIISGLISVILGLVVSMVSGPVGLIMTGVGLLTIGGSVAQSYHTFGD